MKRWKTIRSKIAYRCKYFEAIIDDFVSNRGRKGKFYKIKIKNYAVIVAKNGDYLYLVDFFRYTTGKRSLEFPRGAIEKGETPPQAAKRELKEEAGIVAKKIKKIGWYYAMGGVSDQKAYIFLAENLKISKLNPDLMEREGNIKVRKIKTSQIGFLIQSEKINNAETIAAFSIFMSKRKSNKN